MHFPKIKVTVAKINAKVSTGQVVEPQVRSEHRFVDANDAFYRAIVAEIKLRRPRTTMMGKLYQRVRQWSWKESDEMNWGLIMTRYGTSVHLEEFSEDWKLEGLREVLLMPVKPQRFFWTPKSY